jgi:hypothetical protein
LQWNPAVLTFKQITFETLSPFGSGSINSGNPGNLGFSWFNGVGTAVTSGENICTVILTAAANAAAGPTSISFSQPPFDTLQVGFLGGSSEQPNTVNGSIQVVPEPVNWALGLFACVFTGAATVRWISVKRKSSQAG